MDRARALAIIEAYNRLEGTIHRLYGRAFDKQLAFILDPSRLKSALCSRRAGKSTAAAIYLFIEALSQPNVTCLYVALTRASAKAIMWDLLKGLGREADLGLTSDSFNETDLTCRLPNGSLIKLFGADANQKQREKLLGQAYRLVLADEAASFHSDLRSLTYEILKPATADHGGTIALIGTPDPVGYRHNFFFDVTTGAEPGWSKHAWSTFDNPHMAVQWQGEITDIERDRPLYKETPEYECHYLGRWSLDASKLVYRYADQKNGIDALPLGGHWTHVIALDLGWNDATAFTVAGWRKHDGNLYVPRSYKRASMLLSDVARELESLRTDYPAARFVVDGASKQAVEELKHRTKLPLIPTEKADKATFIRMMNTDLQIERIKVVRSGCTDLIDEWGSLQWDERASRPTELAACKNDAADSALYAWRFARNFLAEPAADPKPHPTSERAVDAFWDRESRRKEQPEWEVEDA